MSAPIVIDLRGDKDPCHGCVRRGEDGTFSWSCLGCKRYYPDLYSAGEEEEEGV